MKTKTIARFEKVSYEQFKKDFVDAFNIDLEKISEDKIKSVYEQIKLPRRATSGSAGYDFFVPITIDIVPHTNVKIPTGIRCYIDDGYVLKIYPRSGLGFKYRMQLDNSVAIIDSDYYQSDNEGHIFIKVTNDTLNDKTIHLKKGDGFAQGIFEQYFLAEEDEVTNQRNGGFGSTNNQ